MNDSLRNLVAVIGGLLFGLGLALSEMINPRRVLGFLDVLGDWDPTLLFVMIGAIPVSAIAYLIVKRSSKPRLAETYQIPRRTDIDRTLLGGAALFGIGWGIGGYCPGPIIAMFSLQWREPIIFVAAMLLGSLLYRIIRAQD
jgi:uncharacterized membrane protein YedE/YeeE